jgi:hypothetical protein
VTGCGSSADNNSPAGPKILSVQRTVSPENVLAYTLTVDTDKETTIAVKVTPDDTSVDPWTVDGPATAGVENAVVIAGLREKSKYALEITATDAGGRTAVDDSQSITTDPLPADMPPIKVTKNDPARMASGYTLFDIFGWVPGAGTDLQSGWLVMLDADGQVVWYAHTHNRPEDSRLMPDGNIGYSYAGQDNDGFIELDAMSEVANQWVASALPSTKVPDGAIKVDVDSIHHEVFPMPNGNYLTLAPEMRQIDQTTCPNYSGTLNVVGDDIVEFDPKTGAIVNKVSEFDFLDPCRRTDHGFEAGFWNTLYGGITTQDWTHSNAVIYDAKRKLVLVSVRHQDWVAGLSWPPSGSPKNDVAWLLGPEGNAGDYGTYKHFTSQGASFDWQYHEHAPMMMKNGDILLFDNGNLRPGTNFDPNDAQGDADLPYSRVVQFHIDTQAMTISQVWDWKAPDGNGGYLYCPFIGDADELDNGDVLATFGGVVDPPSDKIAASTEKKFGRIVELVPGSNDDIVYQVDVSDPTDSYSIYRAERVKGFLR